MEPNAAIYVRRVSMARSPLFQPLTIKAMTLPNRFVMPAMQRGWSENGHVNDRIVGYYRERAEGGTGLIITEGAGVDHPSMYRHWGEIHMTRSTRDGWARCVDAVKGAGGHILIQLAHPGPFRKEGQGSDVPPLSASGIFDGRPNGEAATSAQLSELEEAFVRAAVTADEIGADGVELHMCHGHLLHSFLCEKSNRRDDDYGGPPIENRARFPARVVAAIRSAIAAERVISCRYSQWTEWDYHAQAAKTPDELRTLLRALRAAGADLFHISARYFTNPEWPESEHPELPAAGWAKLLTDAPVITVGSVGLDRDVFQTIYGDASPASCLDAHLRELDARLRRGEFDLVAVGRSLVSDPELVNKVGGDLIDQVRTHRREHLAEIQANLEQGHHHDAMADAVRREARSGDLVG